MELAREDKNYATIWRDKIEEWLQAEGWQVGHQTHPETQWLLTIRDNRGRPLAVAQPSVSKDQIVITLGIALDEGLQQLIGGLEPTERRNLIFDLHEACILAGVQYAEIQEPLRRFLLESVCYLDGLTKNEFLSRINRVRDMGVLAFDKIARAMNQPPPPPSAQPRLGFRAPGS